ncbi:MAG: molybdopterin-dependent oxidoreductase [Actinobacteria bacterium]|nr:molybdopterin-dependent oxidoreductase [Actinomycetota bacterium]
MRKRSKPSLISRREFLKLAGLGAGASAVLTGCGPLSRYVVRQPYGDMPEFTITGQSTFFATTCGECSAGCGLIVRTTEGRAHKVEGNRQHPVSRGGTCSRGQATVQGLYNPDRIQGPGRQVVRGSGAYLPMTWDDAVRVVRDGLQKNQPDEIAFLAGLFPDHLFDLFGSIAQNLGGAHLLRYGTLGEMEARSTLIRACRELFAQAKLPTFDVEHTGLVLSFGSSFVETWISPVAYSFAYGAMRQGHTGRRGYMVHFEPRMSQTAINADEWFPIRPGTEALVAIGLGRLVAEEKHLDLPAGYANVQLADVAVRAGVSEGDLRRVASAFANSPSQVAIPGGVPLGQTNGLAAAEAILTLNILADNLGKPGGLFLTPDLPLAAKQAADPSSIAEVASLIDKMNQGKIKTLFIHGANPVYDLPKSYGFAEALEKVPQVVSFASFPDETALSADFVFPDHTPLESWGYQRVVSAGDRPTVSGLQPAVAPLYDTRATADVFLAAIRQTGGALSAAVPYADEVDYLQSAVAALIDQGGFYTAPTAQSFFVLWQQYGGWWTKSPVLQSPAAAGARTTPVGPPTGAFAGDESEYPFVLFPFPGPNLADGSQANRPTLQETPDPSTTVMWNTWVELNPKTAAELGISDDDVVRITSPAGSVECSVYLYPPIHPGAVAIPLGQGHTAMGRYAKDRGIHPLNLLPRRENEAGNLAHASTRVKIEKTGKRFVLARYESREGVYGEEGRPGRGA